MVGEAQPGQQRAGVERAGVEAGDQPQPLAAAHRRGHAARLQHDAHPRAQLGPGRGQAEHLDRARVGRAEALADLHRGRLARAVGAEHRGDRSALGPQREAVDGGVAAVAFDQVDDLDGWGVHVTSLGTPPDGPGLR